MDKPYSEVVGVLSFYSFTAIVGSTSSGPAWGSPRRYVRGGEGRPGGSGGRAVDSRPRRPRNDVFVDAGVFVVEGLVMIDH